MPSNRMEQARTCTQIDFTISACVSAILYGAMGLVAVSITTAVGSVRSQGSLSGEALPDRFAGSF
jgi:hypothetical protein